AYGVPGRQIGLDNVAEDGARAFVELLQLGQRGRRSRAVEGLVGVHGVRLSERSRHESRWTDWDPSNGPAFCGCWPAPARLGCAASLRTTTAAVPCVPPNASPTSFAASRSTPPC